MTLKQFRDSTKDLPDDTHLVIYDDYLGEVLPCGIATPATQMDFQPRANTYVGKSKSKLKQTVTVLRLE